MVEKRFRLRVLGVAVRGGKEPTTGETGVDSEGETMQSWKEGRVEGISIPSVGVLLDRPCCLRRGRAGGGEDGGGGDDGEGGNARDGGLVEEGRHALVVEGLLGPDALSICLCSGEAREPQGLLLWSAGADFEVVIAVRESNRVRKKPWVGGLVVSVRQASQSCSSTHLRLLRHCQSRTALAAATPSARSCRAS